MRSAIGVAVRHRSGQRSAVAVCLRHRGSIEIYIDTNSKILCSERRRRIPRMTSSSHLLRYYEKFRDPAGCYYYELLNIVYGLDPFRSTTF